VPPGRRVVVHHRRPVAPRVVVVPRKELHVRTYKVIRSRVLADQRGN
jgi:hypothetical protein